ncbi:excitatory amino acid transporter isoform X2 [Planococcus citri]|uniref:excitatory amino acid transporter isoform X2 n=1 Tax=Planococcus citri TaxID=170843 RepID=UPI0031F819B8
MADMNNECTPFNVDSNRPANKMEPSKRQKKSIFQKLFTGQELLTSLTVISTVLAVLVGLSLRSIYADRKWSEREIMYIQFLGDLFLRMLKMLIIPLLMCSIIAAIGTLDLSLSKKIGLQSVAYYVATTSLAVFQGIFWVLTIAPGKYAQDPRVNGTMKDEPKRNVTTVDTLLDLARNLFPPNIIEACVSQDRTVLTYDPMDEKMDINDTLTWKMTMDVTRGTNVLGLVAFSIALGIACARMGQRARPFIEAVEALGEAVMMMTKGVIWFSPFGVFFLVIKSILEMESFAVLLGQMGLYFLTVLLGLFVHGFVTVPSIYLLFLRKFPFKFIKNMSPAIVTAFGTGSSSASLPVSMHCLEGANKVDVRVSRFVMPIGATINMDGTALYEAVAAIFISQVKRYSLSIGQILAVSVTATMASIGAAGIPQAGLVTMVMVLDTVGLPANDIVLILAVDWLLDRFRTVVNVLGDAIGAGVIAVYSKDELRRLDELAKNQSYNYPDTAPSAPNENWNMTPM